MAKRTQKPEPDSPLEFKFKTLADVNRGHIGRPFTRTAEEKLLAFLNVLDFMAKGYTLTASCGAVGIRKPDMYEWPAQIGAQAQIGELTGEALATHLKTLIELAHSERLFALETLLMHRQGKDAAPVIFALKCAVQGRDEWREGAVFTAPDPDRDAEEKRVEVEFFDGPGDGDAAGVPLNVETDGTQEAAQ